MPRKKKFVCKKHWKKMPGVSPERIWYNTKTGERYRLVYNPNPRKHGYSKYVIDHIPRGVGGDWGKKHDVIPVTRSMNTIRDAEVTLKNLLVRKGYCRYR